MYGAEPDEDLVPLCGHHHRMFHHTHGGVPPKMKEATQIFINHMKQVEQHPVSLDDL